MRLRDNMLGRAGLMAEKREDEVTEVTVRGKESVSRVQVLKKGGTYSSRVL